MTHCASKIPSRIQDIQPIVLVPGLSSHILPLDILVLLSDNFIFKEVTMKYFLVSMLVFLAGCSTVGFSPASSSSFPAYSGDVAVLDSIPANYTDVGWVSCEAANNIQFSKLIDTAKGQASKEGANAIVINNNSFQKAFGRNSLVCRAIIYAK